MELGKDAGLKSHPLGSVRGSPLGCTVIAVGDYGSGICTFACVMSKGIAFLGASIESSTGGLREPAVAAHCDGSDPTACDEIPCEYCGGYFHPWDCVGCYPSGTGTCHARLDSEYVVNEPRSGYCFVRNHWGTTFSIARCGVETDAPV